MSIGRYLARKYKFMTDDLFLNYWSERAIDILEDSRKGKYNLAGSVQLTESALNPLSQFDSMQQKNCTAEKFQPIMAKVWLREDTKC